MVSRDELRAMWDGVRGRRSGFSEEIGRVKFVLIYLAGLLAMSLVISFLVSGAMRAMFGGETSMFIVFFTGCFVPLILGISIIGRWDADHERAGMSGAQR